MSRRDADESTTRSVNCWSVFTGGSPAYALTDNPNGTVTLSVDRPAGIAEANRAFASRGDHVVVVPVRAGCADISTLAAPPVPGTRTQSSSTARRDGSSITLDVQGIPAGRSALVSVDTSSEGTFMGMAMITGVAPDCVTLPTTPPPGTTTHQYSGNSGNSGGFGTSGESPKPGDLVTSGNGPSLNQAP